MRLKYAKEQEFKVWSNLRRDWKWSDWNHSKDVQEEVAALFHKLQPG